MCIRDRLSTLMIFICFRSSNFLFSSSSIYHLVHCLLFLSVRVCCYFTVDVALGNILYYTYICAMVVRCRSRIIFVFINSTGKLVFTCWLGSWNLLCQSCYLSFSYSIVVRVSCWFTVDVALGITCAKDIGCQSRIIL